MGQKINPFGYRLGITENHRSKWFSDSNKAASSSSAPATAFASTFTPPVRAS